MTRIKAWQSSKQQECEPRNYERGQSREAATLLIITTIYPAKNKYNKTKGVSKIKHSLNLRKSHRQRTAEIYTNCHYDMHAIAGTTKPTLCIFQDLSWSV